MIMLNNHDRFFGPLFDIEHYLKIVIITRFSINQSRYVEVHPLNVANNIIMNQNLFQYLYLSLFHHLLLLLFTTVDKSVTILLKMLFP